MPTRSGRRAQPGVTPGPGIPKGRWSYTSRRCWRTSHEVALDPGDRERLRFVALIHDTFKHRVDRYQPREGANHHAVIARRFASRYSDDVELLEIIELHDEAFNAWVKGDRGGKWDAAEARARRLLDRVRDLGGLLCAFLPR